MPDYVARLIVKWLLYISIILPFLVITYGLIRPGILKNVQKLDGYIYRAYIVIIFCCAAQVFGGLQDIVFKADTHIIMVQAVTGIFQNVLFFTILKCMNGCESCKEQDAPQEPSECNTGGEK